jgi:cell division protein FtsL
VFRLIESTVVVTTIVVAIALYTFKYDTENAAGRIADLKREIAKQDDAIRILRAEWSLLNQPDRLQKLAERHLELEPVKPEQIKTYADLPRKSPNDELADLVRRSISGVAVTVPPDPETLR